MWHPPDGASISCAAVHNGLVILSCAQLRELTALGLVHSGGLPNAWWAYWTTHGDVCPADLKRTAMAAMFVVICAALAAACAAACTALTQGCGVRETA